MSWGQLEAAAAMEAKRGLRPRHVTACPEQDPKTYYLQQDNAFRKALHRHYPDRWYGPGYLEGQRRMDGCET